MKDITIIIPLHEYNDEVKKLLTRALSSVPDDYTVLVSTNGEIADKLSNEDYFTSKNYSLITSEKTDFCSLVNNAVSVIETNYFSILEYDDVYTKIWAKNMEEHIKFKPEVSVFLPLTDLFDYNNDSFIGYGNEAPWASSFSSEIGYIDNECLQNFFDFYLTGSVFNTKDWVQCGGLKPSIELTFWYEFLLRLTNLGKFLYVVPKVCYNHYVDRPESIYNHYKNSMTEKESTFWFDVAKQECLFKKDREKKYVLDDNNNKEEV